MCRQNQLWSCVLMSFGVGVLIGTWLSGGFFCYCFALGMIILGAAILRRK